VPGLRAPLAGVAAVVSVGGFLPEPARMRHMQRMALEARTHDGRPSSGATCAAVSIITPYAPPAGAPNSSSVPDLARRVAWALARWWSWS